MEQPPLQKSNKVYSMSDFKPKFIIDLQNYFRKIKLGWYKKKKVNESKTQHKRYYHMKFKIHIDDELNPQESNVTYEMVVPARAAFFAKMLLERSVKEKLSVSVVDWDEMTDEEHDELLQSKKEYAYSKLRTCEHKGEQMPLGKNKFHCMDCHEEYTTSKD